MNNIMENSNKGPFRQYWEALLFSFFFFPVGHTLDSDSIEASSDRQVLKPYLGAWQPTSFQAQLKSGKWTISEKEITTNTGNSLQIEFLKREGNGIIFRAKNSKPPTAWQNVRFVGMFIDQKPNQAGRRDLHICYSKGNLELLSKIVKVGSYECSNIFSRVTG